MNGRLHIVVHDCPDPRALASCYGELAGTAALARDPPDLEVAGSCQADRGCRQSQQA